MVRAPRVDGWDQLPHHPGMPTGRGHEARGNRRRRHHAEPHAAWCGKPVSLLRAAVGQPASQWRPRPVAPRLPLVSGGESNHPMGQPDGAARRRVGVCVGYDRPGGGVRVGQILCHEQRLCLGRRARRGLAWPDPCLHSAGAELGVSRVGVWLWRLRQQWLRALRWRQRARAAALPLWSQRHSNDGGLLGVEPTRPVPVTPRGRLDWRRAREHRPDDGRQLDGLPRTPVTTLKPQAQQPGAYSASV